MPDSLPPLEELEITVEALDALRRSETAVTLVDCREDDEFALCRIEGSTLIPTSRMGELFSNLGEPDQDVVVYCHHGMRSAQATQFLRLKGYKRTWSLAGGIDLWSQNIDPEVPRY